MGMEFLQYFSARGQIGRGLQQGRKTGKTGLQTSKRAHSTKLKERYFGLISCFKSVILLKMENHDLIDTYGLAEIKRATEKRRDSNITQPDEEELSSSFSASHQGPEDILLVLRGYELTIKQADCEETLSLQFWTVCEFVKVEDRVSGFRLSIGTENHVFYSVSSQTLEKWKKLLTKRVVRWGFYEDYKPLAKIGMGKSASVFLARRRSDNEKVAIKAFLKSDAKTDPKSSLAIENEVSILRGLDHPNLIKIFGFYQTDKSFYLVLEYIEGQTLKQYIETQLISHSQSLHLVEQLAAGLKYLAKKDIAHRDIKPDNIILSSSNRPVIVDFGLATECGVRNYIYKHCGTPGYVAPEILLKDNDRITPNVDMFSLGIVLHLLIFKKFPYTGRDFSNILEQNRLAQFNFHSHEYAFLPSETKILLEQMLDSNPRDRISARRLVRKLAPKVAERIVVEAKGVDREREDSLKLVRSGSLEHVVRRRFHKLY